MPGVCRPVSELLVGKSGIRIAKKMRQTPRDAKFLKRDFVLDIIYTYDGRPDTGGNIIFIGMGEALLGGAYDEPRNSVCLRMHPPDFGGGAIELAPGGPMGGIAEPGTHMVRVEKKGDSVTFSICRNYEGKFEADIEKTIPDIKAHAPFLTDKTTFLFFGGGGTFQKIRLTYSPT